MPWSDFLTPSEFDEARQDEQDQRPSPSEYDDRFDDLDDDLGDEP